MSSKADYWYERAAAARNQSEQYQGKFAASVLEIAERYEMHAREIEKQAALLVEMARFLKETAKKEPDC